MKKRSLAVVFLILTIVLAVSLTACSGLFNSDPKRYYIDIGQVEDARTASIVANNTIGSSVRVITSYANGTTSASSGFVVTDDGYVVTNRHCVVRYLYNNGTTSDLPQFPSDKPISVRSYSVVFIDNKEFQATLVEVSDTADIAVLKIQNGKFIKEKFQPLVLETEHDLYYGERVYTIGNPENIGLIFTELAIASPAIRLNKDDRFDSIVLDGNINHGNSGGPLLNSYSRVSGIVYARIDGNNSDAYGIGCAIPASEIIKFLKSVNVSYKTTPTSASVSSGD